MIPDRIHIFGASGSGTSTLTWAGAYETGVPDGRCRSRHEVWLKRLPPPRRVLRLDGTRSVDALVDVVLGVPAPGTTAARPPAATGR